jgi:hypothetical protein
MNRRAHLLELLAEFTGWGGVIELRDGDLHLLPCDAASREVLARLHPRRFDLLDILDGTTACTWCDMPIDRHARPGRILEPGLGAHDSCFAERHARRGTVRGARAMRAADVDAALARSTQRT